MPENDHDAFVASLMESGLYSIGAFFHDAHPDLVDEVVDQAAEIERAGLERYASDRRMSVDTAFQTLVTGLAVRYYRAVTG